MQRLRLLLALLLSPGLIIALSAFFSPQTDAISSNKFTSPTFTSSPDIQPSSTPIDISPPDRPPLSLTIFLICFCLLFLLVIGVIVLGVIIRNQNMKEVKK